MLDASRWSRLLVIVGLSALLVGLIDPLEGSFVILLGSTLLTVSAILGHSRYRALLVTSFALLALGIAALFWVSALGGIGGTSGRSNWWWLAILPYPMGWLLGLYGAVLRLRESQPARQPRLR